MSEDPKGFDAGDYNLFRYCNNDPLDKTDPMGTEWEYYGDQHDWQLARQYLSRDPVMRSIIQTGDKLSQKIPILANNKHIDRVRPQGPTTVDWDPHSAIRTPENGKQSPALGLGHELDHAVRRETDRKGYERDVAVRDKQYGNREERRVIEGSERHAANALGEDSRSGHRLDSQMDRYHTASPVSREPGVPPNAQTVEPINQGVRTETKIFRPNPQ
jgi:hypothetical protein